MTRILLIDDNESFRNTLCDYLGEYDYEVTEAEDSFEAIKTLEQGTPYDLILCDIDMPELDGLQLLTVLQEQFTHMPVVMLTGHEDAETAVKAMRLGAKNYVLKSKLIFTLLDTIEATLKQHQENIKELLNFSNLARNIVETSNSSRNTDGEATTGDDDVPNQRKIKINTTEREVFFDKHVLKLTETEFDILACLIEADGDVQTYEQIMFAVHGDVLSQEEARCGLSAHISNLRNKLEELGCDDAVMTRRSRGYFIKSKYL
jgi:DNA-binding response OmpR family regulator